MFLHFIKSLISFYSLDIYLYWQVMQKVFALLMAELRKLGAAIVFASFSRVIIDTGKSDLAAAKTYCESVLKTLQTRFVSACILMTCNRLINFYCMSSQTSFVAGTCLSGLNLSLSSFGIPCSLWIRLAVSWFQLPDHFFWFGVMADMNVNIAAKFFYQFEKKDVYAFLYDFECNYLFQNKLSFFTLQIEKWNPL